MDNDLQSRLATSLSGTYSLERELGGGGMSRVFMAGQWRYADPQLQPVVRKIRERMKNLEKRKG